MLDGDTVVFVEVRYRKHAAWGGALESVDARKRQRLILAAELFLQRESRWGRQPFRNVNRPDQGFLVARGASLRYNSFNHAPATSDSSGCLISQHT